VLSPRGTGACTIGSLLAGDWAVFRAPLARLVLPSISLGLFALAPIARITRAGMLQALGSEFTLTLRASGQPARKVLVTYAFRNALLPISSVLGLVFSFRLGANVLIEQVYGWQGIGAYPVPIKRCTDLAKAKARLTRARYPARLQDRTVVPNRDPGSAERARSFGDAVWGLSCDSPAPYPAASMSATAIYPMLIRRADWSAVFTRAVAQAIGYHARQSTVKHANPWRQP
jgi:hypothetical protein